GASELLLAHGSHRRLSGLRGTAVLRGLVGGRGVFGWCHGAQPLLRGPDVHHVAAWLPRPLWSPPVATSPRSRATRVRECGMRTTRAQGRSASCTLDRRWSRHPVGTQTDPRRRVHRHTCTETWFHSEAPL